MGVSWRALTLWALWGARCVSSDQVLVASLVDDIVPVDYIEGGDCYEGCIREIRASAHVEGDKSTEGCGLVTTTPFTSNAPEDGTLKATVYCKDRSGALVPQGVGVCQFSVCVDYAWNAEEGEVYYDVVITRADRPRGEHAVHVDLSVDVDPFSLGAFSPICEKTKICDVKKCTGDISYLLKINLWDEYGDGWGGGARGRFNTWSLTQNTEAGDVFITRGTLAPDQASLEHRECVGDGTYTFATTAHVEWAFDMTWSLCGATGKAGDSLTFEVSGSGTSEERCAEVSRASLIVLEEVDGAAGSYCTLPEEDTCTSLSGGLGIEGVGIIHDARCVGTDLPGCKARLVDSCRLCFFDRELWRLEYPGEREPDWEDCPCCVARHLGFECTTGGGGGLSQATVINIAVGLSCALALSVCIACSCGTQLVRTVSGNE
ncbi:unnamed protein product [Discosporangium mesarthrocarpum]